MPTHRNNGLPVPHGSEDEPGWRLLLAECPSRCEELYIVGHINVPGET